MSYNSIIYSVLSVCSDNSRDTVGRVLLPYDPEAFLLLSFAQEHEYAEFFNAVVKYTFIHGLIVVESVHKVMV